VKLFKSVLLGLILLPLTMATMAHLPSEFMTFRDEGRILAFLMAGVTVYVLIEIFLSRPMRTYVFGHELTHALASIMMGGKIHSFKMSAKGGSVSMSKTNFFVALAPYCVPIYSIALFLAYWAFKYWSQAPILDDVFLVLLGGSLAFHGSLTWYAMRQNQPDLRKTGTFFSVIFILLLNCWVLLLVSKLIFGDKVQIADFSARVFNTQTEIWGWVWSKVNLIK